MEVGKKFFSIKYYTYQMLLRVQRFLPVFARFLVK